MPESAFWPADSGLASFVFDRNVTRVVRSAKVIFFRIAIMNPPSFNSLPRPSRCPSDTVVSYPVVGLTSETPIANRGLQRQGLAIKNKLPVCGSDRSYDLVSTAAATEMRGRCEPYRNVNRSLLQLFRNELDEFVLEDDFPSHCGRSSLTNRLVSIPNWLCCSDLRSR